MRVVIAPDSFKGTLDAPAAAGAIARGWRRVRPHDELLTHPLSDGGDGLVQALGPRIAARRHLTVTGPRGRPRPARVGRLRPPPGPGWEATRVSLLADVRTTLVDAARVYAPQKGADPAQVRRLERGLQHWADVVEDHLARPGLRTEPGTGAAGGLAYGLVAGLGARVVDGARWVAATTGLDDRLAAADLLVVGEGQLDGTSFAGKVVGHALDAAARFGVPTVAVVGRRATDGISLVEEASPAGPGPAPAEEVADAAARLAARVRAG